MSDLNTSQNPAKEEGVSSELQDLIFEHDAIEALIKGLEGDIKLLNEENIDGSKASQIVRFTMQLNIFKDKRARNLHAINDLVMKKKGE